MPEEQKSYPPVKISHPEPGKLQAMHAKNILSTAAAKVADAEAAAATEAERLANMKPGDRMEDGTIFAGISPDTNAPMYALPEDEAEKMTFYEGMKRASDLSKETDQEYRMPSKTEMKVIFNNHAAIGGLDETIVTGSFYGNTWYWSSTTYDERPAEALVQRFNSDSQAPLLKTEKFKVRLIRN